MHALGQLSLIPGLEPAPVFDGQTYEAKHDADRLSTQLEGTREVLLDHKWHSIAQIVDALRKQGMRVTEASISARIRDLRKAKFGGFNVERRRASGGLFEYSIPQVQA